MSNRFKKIKTQKSEIRKKLLQEAATLEKNVDFMELIRGNKIKEVLLMFRLQDGHNHRVLPGEEVAIQMLVDTLEEEYGVDTDELTEGMGEDVATEEMPKLSLVKEERKLPRRIVFHNRQAIGDIFMFTCAVRDFKQAFPEVEVQVRSTAMHIWDHNPHINRENWIELLDYNNLYTGDLKKLTDKQRLELNKKSIQVAIESDQPVMAYIGPGKATNASNRTDSHFANAFRLSMENLLGVRIPQGPIRADIHMSEAEYAAPPIVEPPYWLIVAGEKGDWTCKTFSFGKWQEVVKSLPEIKFVQLGSPGHKHPELVGDNVVNLIGKTEDRHTGIRDLFNLYNNCQGSMGLVSFQMHLAAAFNKPCLVIAGAREPVHFTRYPGQQYLASDGCLPCTIRNDDVPTACWKCKIEGCPYHSDSFGQKIPLCADLFSADDVVRAILRYYEGGRLNFDNPVGRSKLVNRVKEPAGKVVTPPAPVLSEEQPACAVVEEKKPLKIVTVDPEPQKTESEIARKEILKVVEKDDPMYGFTFGGGCITDRDWEFMKGVIEENNIKTVLEFGCGLSTLLMLDMGLEVVSFETHQGWVDKINGLNPKCDIRLWDGVNWDFEPGKCDFAFVDGPPGGVNREHSTRVASEYADVVIVHDAGRKEDKEWQAMYMEPEFYLASKGGHRCHLWKKGHAPKLVLDEDKKLLKLVFNGRGDGGAERTTRFLMDEFIKKGWQVQYISPNPAPCGTFNRLPVKGVVFTDDLLEIRKPCDILLLYANDWWDLGNTAKTGRYFENIWATRKVMTLNYKVMGMGKVEWSKGWDQYLSLNSSMLDAAGLVGKVLAPPTDLTPFFDIEPEYNGNLKIVRHNSQGDAKYPKPDFDERDGNKYMVKRTGFSGMCWRILEEIPDAEIHLLPATGYLDSELKDHDRIFSHKKGLPDVIPPFLKNGNCFWYKLPEGGYTEGGPKVIMEAQAAGLPVIADNHSGAVDRLANGGGFLCNDFEGHLSALKELARDPNLRRALGEVSRDHARKNYGPQVWIEAIIGE